MQIQFKNGPIYPLAAPCAVSLASAANVLSASTAQIGGMSLIPSTFATHLPAAVNLGWQGLFLKALYSMLFGQLFMAPSGQVPSGLGVLAAMSGAKQSVVGLSSLAGMFASPTPVVQVNSSQFQLSRPTLPAYSLISSPPCPLR